jgi:hypothetical protein
MKSAAANSHRSLPGLPPLPFLLLLLLLLSIYEKARNNVTTILTNYEHPSATSSLARGIRCCPPHPIILISPRSPPAVQLNSEHPRTSRCSREILLRRSNGRHPGPLRPLRWRLVRSLCQRLAKRHRPVERRVMLPLPPQHRL